MDSTIPTPLPRIEAFERLGFGLFLHWGLYSQIGTGEWMHAHEGMPVAEYARLITTFTARHFDARSIARLARESGMRYICLTTRHHEGFSLYDTRGLSDFDALHSPAGRDLVAEFADACRAEGVSPFFYHTTLDLRWDSQNCSEAKFNEYLDYLNASVEILCRHYGKIGGIWFDGNWSRQADWKEDRLYTTIRRHQPDAIIVNNTGLDARGVAGHPELDSVTFEQGLPSAPDRRGWPKYMAGEMCETMNRHWGIVRNDFHFMSPGTVIEHLCACRKVGANYLLNVGPTRDGEIPAYEAAVLRIVGDWIKRHGSMIYDAKPVAASCPGKDFVLKKGSRFYYFAHDMYRRDEPPVVQGGPSRRPRTVDGFPDRISRIRWLNEESDGRFIQSADGKLLTLECPGYDYGDDYVVLIAEMEEASG
jgi:alpha-L-fucosidase